MRIHAQQVRTLTIGFFTLASAVLGLAGWLLLVDRADAAVDLVQLVAAVGGAAFGGYGVAKGISKNDVDE